MSSTFLGFFDVLVSSVKLHYLVFYGFYDIINVEKAQKRAKETTKD